MSNPFEISRLRDAFSKSVKSDLIDAFVIAQALRMNVIKESQKDETYIFLQDLLERFYDLKDRQKALTNQLRSNLEQTFPEIDRMFTNISCNSALAILANYATASDLLDATIENIKLVIKQENGKMTQNRLDQLLLRCQESVAWKTQTRHKIIIQSQVRELKMVKQEIQFLNEAINEYVDDVFASELQLLKSVPGVSDLTAFYTLAVIGNHERFDPDHDGDEAKRVSSFVGYSLKEYSSGSRKVQGGISKRGNGKLRGLLYMASMSAVRVDDDLKYKYERSKLSKGSAKKALVAISHLLLRRCYGVLKSGKFYNADIPRAGAAG